MTSEPVTFDPSAWTGMEPPWRWPSPKDYPRPLPLVVRESRVKHLAAGYGLLLASLVCALLAVSDIYKPNRRSSPAIGFVLSAVLAAVGLGSLRSFYREGVSGRIVVKLNADGLTVPLWFGRTIPWSEVTEAMRMARGVHIAIRGEGRFNPSSLRKGWGWRPHPPTLPSLLDVWPSELIRSIHAHRAHFGNGGQSGS